MPAKLLAHPERLALRPTFVKWAAHYGVPADLLQAMCWVESGWQSGVVSRSGAIGIGQLQPATVDQLTQVLVEVIRDAAGQQVGAGAEVELALNPESVYYRSARQRLPQCPGRILWYVSQDAHGRRDGGTAGRRALHLELDRPAHGCPAAVPPLPLPGGNVFSTGSADMSSLRDGARILPVSPARERT